MGRLFWAAIAAWISFTSFAATTRAAGPYVEGTFRGRIAYSADGNHNDRDDWAASPLALAIIAQAGLKDRLVHFDYNCILPETDPEWEKIHATSVLGAARHYGYELSRFHDCRQHAEAAIDDITRIIDASSAADPLYFIVAGPMEVPFRGIEKSRPDKRPFVYCISHSRWNDGFASNYKFTHTKRSVIESGVNWVQIADQNRLLSLSPYGQPGPAESFAPFHWMRDSKDQRLRFLFERIVVSTRPDPSDAGMAYFLVSGDEQASPEKLRALLEDHVPLKPAIRQRVRLEAENFRQLGGFEIDSRSDRTASHRLSVKHAGGAGLSIQTPYREPYAQASGRFDVTVRYRQPDGSPAMQVQVGGTAPAKSETARDKQGWQLATFQDVPITEGDTLTVTAAANQVSIDYVELTNKNPPPKQGQ